VYFNGSIYLAGVGSPLKQFKFASGALPATATSQSAASFAFPGTSASISANGTTNGIVWAAESNASSAAVLHAYNPANLAVEYYNSTQAAGGRDSYGNGNKFITPGGRQRHGVRRHFNRRRGVRPALAAASRALGLLRRV
jgi:hypothetical protein